MSTIPGAGHTVVTFSIPNSAGNNYANDFAAAVARATSIATLPTETSVTGGLGVNEFISSSNSVTTVLTTGSQYTLVETFAPSLIQLNASNETVAAGGDVTVQELGTVGGERVIFISGDNTFTGSTSGVGGDTISGGTGVDLISTGGGASTVYGGTASTIYLNDTVASAGDVAVVQSGSSTVYADGKSDLVNVSATAKIFGGSGSLLLTTDGGTVSVTGAGGAFSGYLTSGTDLTFSNAASSPLADIVAGAGNETLDGAGAAGGFAFFADTVSADSGSVTDSVTGGSGYDFFSTGTGTEDYTAGTGPADFEIASVAGGTITINDFSAGDSVNFGGLSVADESTLGSSTTANSITVTLGNGTTVDFVGVTSLSGHYY